MKFILYIISGLVSFAVVLRCGDEKIEQQDLLKKRGVDDSPERDAQIQQYNLKRQKELAANRYLCDVIALKENILDNYPDGTDLVNSYKLLSYDIPEPAVIYYEKDSSYIFCVIAKSRKGERFIEPKNIVGYDQSFIDLDSTELGSAFFFLTLFKCLIGRFEPQWEAAIPSHGGFNMMHFKLWDKVKIPYIRVNFHYGRGTGHIDYNYFLVDGINNKPHLLMTYRGINFKRTIANVNDDRFPDYYEHIYYDLGDRVFTKDSVAFIWNLKDGVYINTRNKKQTRLY